MNTSINLEEAFTDEFRTFDESMKGTFGYFTPISSQAGIVRTLSYNPDIKNVRGFVDTDGGEKSVTEQLSAVELLNPFAAANSDFPRIGMVVNQNKHVTPSVKKSKPLVNSGVHKAIAHIVGDDYAYKAKADGVVESVDEKNQIVVVSYSDGKKGVIDLKPKLVKNVKSGFYLESTLSHSLKKGQKVKKGQILAYDEGLFSPGNDFSGGKSTVEYATGLLAKVAIHGDAMTFEDSVIGSRSLSKDLAFPVVTDKFVSLGPNSHVSKMAKVGDEVKSSDPLIVFENSFDEKDVNDVLRRLGTEHGEEIMELGRNSVVSKTSGKIVDVRVYYNRPLEEFGESLQKVIKAYIRENRARADVVAKTKTEDVVYVHHTEQTTYDKVLGKEFDGVLIQFFVSHLDECKQGDKVSAQVALKGVISQVLDDDERPLSEHDDVPVDLVMSPMSVVSRMTVDLFYNLYCNKVLVELKRKCLDIYKG